MRPNLRFAAAVLLAATPLVAFAGPPAQAPGTLPIYDSTSEGPLAVEAASKAAADSGRRLFVNFGTNDCAPCRVVNDAIYEEPFQTAFFEQFVPVFVDVAPGTPNRALLERYGIDASKGFPALVLSDEQLRVAETTKEGEMTLVAKKGKEAVREWILKRFKKANAEP
jgi:thiol-disulfide isomerase/thioredoxin